jgi:predicted transposase YbfD/YdcC
MVTSRLVNAFSSVREPRVERTRRHDLVDILVVALLAVINGSTAWSDMEGFAHVRLAWLRTFLKLPNGAPSEDTFRRVFEAIDPREFGSAVTAIIEDLVVELAGKVVALDGKTMRGSVDRKRGKGALHVVSAWVSELGISLGQICVDEKSNEITAIPELLKTIDVAGATITIDAMGCQKTIADTIIERGADYILAVKENQPTLHASLQAAFEQAPEKGGAGVEHLTETEGHGRTERRRIRVLRNLAWIPGIDAWQGAKSIVEVERTRTSGDKTSFERAYFISSLSVGAKAMGQRIRSHWGIENSLHWVLDVTFGEDKSRVRSRNGAANLTALRKLSLALLSRAPAYRARSIAQRRKIAGWMPDYAFEVLASISGE